MILWILAVVVVGVVALVGYYQGALRAAFSLLGLFVATLVSVPFSGVAKAILPVFGLKHPVLLDFVGPAVIFVLVMIVFKVIAFAVHRKVDLYYKYKAADTERGLWERMNQRVGACVGVANGAIYALLLGMIFYVVGYFTVQLADAENEHWSLRMINGVAKDVDATRFDQAVAFLVPATPFYFDAVDILGYILHTPLLQQRLSTYPIFLSMAEEQRFQDLGKDDAFQKLWLRRPSLGEFVGNPKIDALVKDPAFYTNVVGMLDGDLVDFKTYLETSQSPKFEDEKILGRWYFSFKASWAEARRKKPNMTVAEKQWTAGVLQSGWLDSVLTAFVDQKISLKWQGGSSGSKKSSIKGRWKREYGNKYSVKAGDVEYEAVVQGRKLTLGQDKLTLVFEK